MSYAILRFNKNKGGSAGAVQAHNERQKESYKSNPDIDPTRSKQNYHLIEPTKSYRLEIDERIKQAGCRVRKDSVKFVETLITASHGLMARLQEAGKERLYFQRALDFLTQDVQKEIFSAVVHMDEKTPHMHVCFVPLTQDGRLSAKEIIGNRTKLMQWQDRYYEHMVKTFPKLERGEPAIQTGREHIPMWMFKKAEKLNRGMEQVKQAVANISGFQSGKKREEAIKLLVNWFSETQNFIGHVNSLRNMEKDLRAQQQDAARTVQSANIRVRDLENEKRDLRMENSYLQNEVRKQQRLIDKVPPEILEQLQKIRNRDRGRERG